MSIIMVFILWNQQTSDQVTQTIWSKGARNSAECRPLPCALETSAPHRLALVNWVWRQRGSREVCDNM